MGAHVNGAELIGMGCANLGSTRGTPSFISEGVIKRRSESASCAHRELIKAGRIKARLRWSQLVPKIDCVSGIGVGSTNCDQAELISKPGLIREGIRKGIGEE